jgi:hypothetical protein
MTESLLNNERCFLAQPAWQAVFNSVIDPTSPSHSISDRSAIVIAILILKSRVSALFADITAAICPPPSPSPSPSHSPYTPSLKDLTNQAHTLRTSLLTWHETYTSLLATAPPAAPSSIEYNKRCEVTSTYLSCRMVTNRLLSAVAVAEAKTLALEAETQCLAGQMLGLGEEVRDVCPHTELFLVQTVWVARSVVATGGEWLDLDGGKGRVVERWKFERWCGLFGRRVG